MPRLPCALVPALMIALAGPVAAQSAAGPASLEWLAGCWERRAGATLTEEQWMVPRGGILLGMSRTVRDGRVVEYEAIRIQEAGGALEYVAHPSGQEPATFRGTEQSDTAVRFENPAHDFPQRIIYRTAGSDSLIATIEGTVGGRERSVEFRYARVSCAGTPDTRR